MRKFPYLFLTFLILLFNGHSVFSSQHENDNKQRSFEISDITKHGKLKEIHFYIEKHFQELNARAQQGQNYPSLKKYFNTLKEGPLSFNNVRAFNGDAHILALKEELWTECTKERTLPDGRQTTMQQELNECINEIDEALSKSEPTETNPKTMKNDNSYDWYQRHRKAQTAFYKSPYGNDQCILVTLKKFQDWLHHLEENSHIPSLEWKKFDSFSHIGLNFWNGHKYLKLYVYPWENGAHTGFYKKPQQRLFLDEFFSLSRRIDTLTETEFYTKLHDMNENEWHQILDTHADLILKTAHAKDALERMRKEEQLRKEARMCEEEQPDEGAAQRYEEARMCEEKQPDEGAAQRYQEIRMREEKQAHEERMREEEQALKEARMREERELTARKTKERSNRHSYILRTFDVSSIDHIVTTLDIVLPNYNQRSSQYTKPVLRFLFRALLQKFPQNMIAADDAHFWSSLLDETMSIREMLQFQAIPTITKSSNERMPSAEEIKMAVIRGYISPKITLIEELISSNNIAGILDIYGLESKKTNAPAA